MHVPLSAYLILSAYLFAVGVIGVATRRNAMIIFMSIELMLNAVNLNLVAAAIFLDPSQVIGQVLVVFVITVAAAEVGLALAIVLRLFRNRKTVNVDEVDLMKW